MKYLRTIREELSAAYHAGANYGLLRDYDNKARQTAIPGIWCSRCQYGSP